MIGCLDSHCLPCVCWCETPPPPFQASTPACVSAHSRIDHAATQVHVPSSPNSFRAYAQSLCLQILCRSAIDFTHLRPRAVAVAGASDAVVAAFKSPGPPPEPQRPSTCCIVTGRWDSCLPDAVRALQPFSPTPRRAPGRASFIPRPMARGTPCILSVVSAS